MKLEQLRGKLAYQALLLGGFCLLGSALLSFGDVKTHDVIATRLAEDLKASLEQVIPAEYYDNDLLKDTLLIDSETLVYLAKKDGKVSAVAFMVTTNNGYSGAIKSIIGIDYQGQVLGVRVIAHAETPGLGDKIEEAKADWILSFNGHSLTDLTESQWKVKKDGGTFDQFSGATITPRAVVGSVYQGLQFFAQHRQTLLKQ
jgi:Na+-translocating ferredoxin:NAD+ oxidoreductase subunit G